MKEVQLFRRDTTEPAGGELHDNLKLPDLFQAERSWAAQRTSIAAELRRRSVPPRQWPGSLHWNWLNKAGDINFARTRQFGVSCDQQWQALMMTRTVPYTARLEPDTNLALVYVAFIETAPWNWAIPAIGQPRDFLGLGVILLRAAVAQSLDEEFHGRVGLHSLPQSERFYAAIGMTPLGSDADKESLVYFEFSRANAERFLTKGTTP